MSRNVLVIATAAFVALCAGCSGHSEDPTPEPTATATSTTVPTPEPTATPTAEPTSTPTAQPPTTTPATPRTPSPTPEPTPTPESGFGEIKASEFRWGELNYPTLPVSSADSLVRVSLPVITVDGGSYITAFLTLEGDTQLVSPSGGNLRVVEPNESCCPGTTYWYIDREGGSKVLAVPVESELQVEPGDWLSRGDPIGLYKSGTSVDGPYNGASVAMWWEWIDVRQNAYVELWAGDYPSIFIPD